MIIVGVYARVEADRTGEIRRRLDGLDGVETFPLREAGTLGILLEAPDLDRAHARLTGEIRGTEGVLAAWPVYMQDGACADSAGAPPWGIPPAPSEERKRKWR